MYMYIGILAYLSLSLSLLTTQTRNHAWVNLLALINEKSTADHDIKAKTMTLINRVSHVT